MFIGILKNSECHLEKTNWDIQLETFHKYFYQIHKQMFYRFIRFNRFSFVVCFGNVRLYINTSKFDTYF